MGRKGLYLNLDALAAGRSVLDIDRECRLDLDEGDAGEVRLQGALEVDNAASRVIVRGELEIAGSAACDRCLEFFELDWVAEVDAVVVRDITGGDPGDDADGDEGSAWTVHQTQGEVDLEPLVREAALLTLPQKMLCREDCLGICAHCGANRNQSDCGCDQEITDPRWDGLPS